MKSTSWRNQLQDIFYRKLGLCRQCILIATIGSLLSWALLIFVVLLFDNPTLIGLASIIAIGFTILLLAHLVAYFLRVYLPLQLALRNLKVIRADLTISTLTPEYVAGAFRQGSIGLSFDAIYRDEQMTLTVRNIQGRELFSAKERDGQIEQSLLEGRMTVSAPILTVSEDMSEREIEIAIEKNLAEIAIQGEEDSLQELQEMAEFKLLPVLSKALGVGGIRGNHFPAIASLHFLALGTFTYQQKHQHDNGGGPPSNGDQPDVVYRIKHQFQEALSVGNVSDIIGGDIVPCDPLADEISIYNPGYKESWAVGCNGTGDCNTTCNCSDDKPNLDDNCLGMCGPGCCCWCDVCGDCCFHWGCYYHDKWCRACDKGNKEACLSCYGPAAGFGFVCR